MQTGNLTCIARSIGVGVTPKDGMLVFLRRKGRLAFPLLVVMAFAATALEGPSLAATGAVLTADEEVGLRPESGGFEHVSGGFQRAGLPQFRSLPKAPIVLAQAEETGEVRRGEGVAERGRRRFEAKGTRAGSFLVFPSLGVTGQYDDNIFSTNTNEVDDFVTLVNPALRLQSDWNNHALNFTANAEIARFDDRSREDYQDYTVGFDSRIDVRRSTNVTAGAAFGAQHELRSSPDDVGGLEPTEIDVTSAQLGAVHRFNRLSIGLNGSGRRLDFDDARTAAGATINNDDRDRSEYDASVRLGLEINPTSEAQVVASYNQTEYDASLDDLGFNRESDGFALQAGMVVDLTGTVFLNFLVGVFEQSFDDTRLSDIDGSTFRAGVEWSATPLTTVTAAVSRSVEETTLTGTSGVLRTAAALGIDHELLRNLIISADVSNVIEDFRGVARDDRTLDFSAGAQFLLHPRIVAEFGVNVTTRDSDVAAQDFDRNRYFVRVVGRL